MVSTALIATGHALALIALAGAALAAGAGLWGLYIAVLSAGLLRAGVYWAALLRAGVRPQFPVDRAVARSLIVNGAPLAITSFLALAYAHVDKLISTAVIGEEGTGQLTAGFVIVFGVIELLSTTVLVAVFPMMSRAHDHRAMFEFMIEKLAFFNLMISLPIAIFTSLLAVPIAALLFGAEFTRTADVLRVLIWYAAAAMVSSVFAQALVIENRQRRTLAIRSFSLTINVALLLILLEPVGVAGAAVASLSAELIALALLALSFRFPADWWRRVISHAWRLALVGAILAGVVVVTRGIHPVVAGLVGAPLYVALALISGAIARDDWDLIYRLALAIPGGSIIGRYWKRELA
jgi:O-antigen/teichoic acid export membrane protein